MTTNREFPNWEQFYQEKEVESMPWFNPELDRDFESGLTRLNLQTGTALDIGTGPGTQAIALTERGFQVTATDLSATAIEKAAAKAQAKGLEISWQQDDILNTNLQSKFDLVLDRGCFHVLPPEQRQNYVAIVANLIQTNGYLFLKCFSHLETMEGGPYRFTPAEIQQIFSSKFNVLSTEQTVYYGTLDPLSKAIFSVLQKAA